MPVYVCVLCVQTHITLRSDSYLIMILPSFTFTMIAESPFGPLTSLTGLSVSIEGQLILSGGGDER